MVPFPVQLDTSSNTTQSSTVWELAEGAPLGSLSVRAFQKTILWFPVFKCVVPIHVQVSVAVWILLATAHDKPRTWKKNKIKKYVGEYLNWRQVKGLSWGQHQSEGCFLLSTGSQKAPSPKTAQGLFSEDCTENTDMLISYILCSKMPLNNENERFVTLCCPRKLSVSWRHCKSFHSKTEKELKQNREGWFFIEVVNTKATLLVCKRRPRRCSELVLTSDAEGRQKLR